MTVNHDCENTTERSGHGLFLVNRITRVTLLLSEQKKAENWFRSIVS